MDELCQVLIFHTKENDSYKGLISGLGDWLFFNPFCFLPEICDNNGNLVFSNYDFSDTYNLTDVFRLKDEEQDQYNAVFNGIKYLINLCVDSSYIITPSILDFLRPYYDITVKLNPICKVDNPTTTSYPLFHYSSFSINEIINNGSVVFYDYMYQCFSPSDILFSIFHFLVENNYKFKKCDHCDRVFATRNLKTQYCPRFSQYPNFVHLHCADAVKDIRQDLRRNKTRMYKNIHAHQSSDKAGEFTTDFYEAFKVVLARSTYKAIDDCYSVLDSKKWYKPDAFRQFGEPN